MAQVLKTGTKSHTKEQIQDMLDQWKSNVNFGYGGQTFFVNFSTYKESLPKVMDLIKVGQEQNRNRVMIRNNNRNLF